MAKKSVYFGPPLEAIAADVKTGESLSGRLNQVAERYLEIVKRHGIDLTDRESFILASCLMGSFIEPLLIRHLADEVEDSEFADEDDAGTLIAKLRAATFADLVATVEKLEWERRRDLNTELERSVEDVKSGRYKASKQ